MNKATKIVIILMITTIVLYTVIGVHKKIENEQNSIQSADNLNSQEDISGEGELEISYEVSSGENEVVLKGISEGSISITTYTFENEELVKIILEEKITSGDNELIENIFNYMRNDSEMSMVYSTIEMQDDTITAVLKDEYVDAYGDASKVEIYEQLLNLIESGNN